MSGPFESIPEPPRADDVVDQAFSRAARAGGANSGTDAQLAMLRTAANVASDNLAHVERSWPDFDGLDPFHRSLADAVIDVDAVRAALGSVGGAARTIEDLHAEYASKIGGDASTATKHRKQAFARIADVVTSTADDLDRLRDSRSTLVALPGIRTGAPTIVVTGAPNVGKTAFVNAVTRATNETASYPFTTERLQVGHVDRGRTQYQVVDTPGIRDRQVDAGNAMARQTHAAIDHLADVVLLLVDSTGAAGYPIAEQLRLREDLDDRFSGPVLTIATKHDRLDDPPDQAIDPAVSTSTTTDRGLSEAIEAAIEAIDPGAAPDQRSPGHTGEWSG